MGEPSWLVRLRKEHEEVNDRWIKLSAYLHDGRDVDLPDEVRFQMNLQKYAMEDYVMSLSERIRLSGSA